MEQYIRVLLLGIFMVFGLVNLSTCTGYDHNNPCYTPAGCSENPADTSDQFSIPVNTTGQILIYPFETDKDSTIYNDFNDHASYCMGCQGNDYDVLHGTPVYAVMAGTATVEDGHGDQSDAQGCVEPLSYGNYVKITSTSWEIIYGHMANGQMEVSNGDSVTDGQLLGYTSNSGFTCGEDVNESSYHLHFEVEYDNVDKDPYAEGYFIIDSDGSYRYPSEVTTFIPPLPTTHLMTVEPNSSGKFDLHGYEVNGSGEDTTLSGPFFSYIDTGNTSTILSWLVGDVDNDSYGYADVVQVRVKDGYTYAQVYLADGEGGLNTQTRWKKTPGTATHAFLGDIDGDDKDDLILVFANTDTTLTWKYFVSSGTGFNTAQTWHSSFGYTVSELVVGDFNGNGQAEAFNGTPGTNNVLTWQRLNGSGTINNISTTFGLSSDELIVADIDIDNDGSDEIIRLDERNSSVECEAAHYHNSSSSFTTTTCGTDVGGTSGDYAIYLLDSTGTYPDLIRSNGTTLYLASGNGTSFEEQSDQHDMVTGLNLADSQSTFLLGNFGTRTSTTSLSIDGDLVDPLDEDDEEPTPPADDDDTGDDDDVTEEPTPSCNNDGDSQTATSCGGTDCNDWNASVYYGAPEICGNGIDDDCVGGDVPCSELYCTDNADNDLDGLVDCNDSDCASNSACAPPAPDHDFDNDGQDAVAYGGQDCNDSIPYVYYGAPEICGNGYDDDCIGGDVPCVELYCSDGADNDLDGAIDCADSNCASNSACAPIPPPCDNDGDGQTATSCGGTDCNDSNGTIYYGAPELCGNSIDDDCVGGDVPCSELYCTDNADNDLDGLVDCNDPDCSSSSACSTPTPVDYDGDGYPDSSDCGWWSANIYPGAPELADWVDNDCDGTIDDGCSYNCNNVYWNGCSDDYAAYYATNSLTYICTGSSSTGSDTDGDGYPDATDCAWWDATTYPGALERSDWNDNDCDGTTDEGCDGSCGGNYNGGCHDDYEWWYLSTATTAPICWP